MVSTVLAGLVGILLAAATGLLVGRRAVRPLGEAMDLQRRFVADASHELRTPLAVLDARIQVVQRSLPPGHELADDMAGIRRDAQSLIDVVGDLLLAAGTEEPQNKSEAADVAAVLLACLLNRHTIDRSFDLVSGETPIEQAVAEL